MNAIFSFVNYSYLEHLVYIKNGVTFSVESESSFRIELGICENGFILQKMRQIPENGQ